MDFPPIRDGMALALHMRNRSDHNPDHTEMGKRQMSNGSVDNAKGRLKEAIGALTDDDDLKREGKIDQATGKVKDAADKVIEKVKKAVS